MDDISMPRQRRAMSAPRQVAVPDTLNSSVLCLVSPALKVPISSTALPVSIRSSRVLSRHASWTATSHRQGGTSADHTPPLAAQMSPPYLQVLIRIRRPTQVVRNQPARGEGGLLSMGWGSRGPLWWDPPREFRR